MEFDDSIGMSWHNIVVDIVSVSHEIELFVLLEFDSE